MQNSDSCSSVSTIIWMSWEEPLCDGILWTHLSLCIYAASCWRGPPGHSAVFSWPPGWLHPALRWATDRSLAGKTWRKNRLLQNSFGDNWHLKQIDLYIHHRLLVQRAPLHQCMLLLWKGSECTYWRASMSWSRLLAFSGSVRSVR